MQIAGRCDRDLSQTGVDVNVQKVHIAPLEAVVQVAGRCDRDLAAGGTLAAHQLTVVTESHSFASIPGKLRSTSEETLPWAAFAAMHD